MNSKFIFIAIGALFLLILIGGVVALTFFVRKSEPVHLTYWGLWEPEAVYETVIADYQRDHPGVTITYTKQSPINYRDRLTSAFSREDGPDIARIHNTWVPMFRTQLAPVPADVYSLSAFRSTFYPTASSDLVLGGKPMAIPLEIDTLILFANEDIFTLGNAAYPTTWDEFRETAKKLTVRNGGRVQTAGAALGTAVNIDHWQDIVDLMMLQAGVDLNTSANSDSAQKALEYYTTFMSIDRVWDETMDSSTLAFSQGKVALYFGPSWRYFDIMALNPNLKVKMLPVPQLPAADPVNFASYWVEGVSAKSKHPKEAFAFLKYLSSKDVLTKLYAAQTTIRGFGEPYSRVDMAPLLTSDPRAGVVVNAAPAAQSWYLASFTNDGDTGINSRVGQYYLDAVNTTKRGGGYAGALDTVKSGLDQVLGDYGISTQ